MIGICEQCGNSAPATFENEGYSDCCNEPIVYGVTAAQLAAEEATVQRQALERWQRERGIVAK